MTSQGDNTPAHSAGSRKWALWFVVALAAIAIALGAWWWVGRDSAEPAASPTASPSMTPSPSVTPSESPSSTASPTPTPTATASTASLSDVEGRWCAAEQSDQCLIIELPYVAWEDGADPPMVLYPPGADTSADPSTHSYDGPPNLGECWNAFADSYPSESGVPYTYCPAGAISNEAVIDDGEYADQDRFLLSSDAGDAPYLRAD